MIALPISVSPPAHLIDRLRDLLPFEGDDVENALFAYRSNIRFARMYRHYFPKEWAQEDRRVPVDLRKHTRLEWRFMDLVNERLFPCSGWEDLEEEENDGRDDRIPIDLHSYDIERINEDPDGVNPYALALAFLDGCQFYEEHVEMVVFDAIGALPDPCPTSKQVDQKALRRDCNARGGMWALLPDALRVSTLNTGTDWLDAQPDFDFSNLTWDMETVSFLARDWKRGRRMEDHHNQFCKWLKANPDQWPEVVAFYHQHLKPRRKPE